MSDVHMRRALFLHIPYMMKVGGCLMKFLAMTGADG